MAQSGEYLARVLPPGFPRNRQRGRPFRVHEYWQPLLAPEQTVGLLIRIVRKGFVVGLRKRRFYVD